MLRALLAMRLGPQRATEIAAKLGQFFAFFFVAAGLFWSPMLIFIGLFIYIAAASELQASELRWFAHDLTVSDGMERTVRSLSASALLSEAVDALLASSQRAFPVVDEMKIPVGLFDRDDLLLGLKEKGPNASVYEVMQKSAVIGVTVSLNDAITNMNRQGIRSQIVVDADDRLAGMLTIENVAEMIMIHKMRPEWSFSHRAK